MQVCRLDVIPVNGFVYIHRENNLFVLQKFEDTDYECTYYFDDIELLENISELLLDTFFKFTL